MRLLQGLIEMYCGSDMHDQLLSLEASWNQEGVVQAFAKYKEWIDNGYFPDGFLTSDPNADARLLLFSGAAAIEMEGTWFNNQIVNEGQNVEDYAYFPFPGETGGARVSAFIDMIQFNKGLSDEELDAAIKYVQFMYSVELGEKYAYVSFPIPQKNAVVPDDQPMVQAILADMEANGTYTIADQGLPQEIVNKLFEVQDNLAYIGINNYVEFLTEDTVALIAIRNNILWILLTIVFTVSLGLLLAVALNHIAKGRVLYRSVFYLPAVLSGIVVATMWSWIYHPQMGFINAFLKAVGLESLARGWLSDLNIAFFAVFIAALWQGLGQPMLLFLAGLQMVPADCLEVARIDGAGPVKTFLNITIPCLRETFVIVMATQIVSAMRVFDIIWGLTGAGPANATQTLGTWMYVQTFRFTNLGYGSAIAWIMTVILMVVIIPYVLYMAKD